jgi:histidinol-phosphatase
MAGARCGAVLASVELTELLRRIVPPYAITVQTIEAVLEALSPLRLDESRAQVERLRSERERVSARLAGLPRVTRVWPSDANFLLLQSPDAGRLLAAGIRGGLLVRDVRSQPGLGDCLRITIGTPEQNDRLVASLEVAAPTLFIDRDGTLIEEPADEQVDAYSKLRFMPGVVPALLALCDAGFRLVMITNQDGLGSASFPHENFDGPHELMMQLFESQGIGFDAVLICPHLPDQDCACRKPKTALVDDYLARAPMDASRSYVIGDRETDLTLARNLGIGAIRVLNDGDPDHSWAAARPLRAGHAPDPGDRHRGQGGPWSGVADCHRHRARLLRSHAGTDRAPRRLFPAAQLSR